MSTHRSSTTSARGSGALQLAAHTPQATELSAASAAPAAWCLAGYADEAVGRTTAVRDALYGSLLAALQLRLAEVCPGFGACAEACSEVRPDAGQVPEAAARCLAASLLSAIDQNYGSRVMGHAMVSATL
jgi:hypothetical protein